MVSLEKQNFEENKKSYEKEFAKLKAVLGENVRIDHVGSTAIPDIYGKNIIDILIAAKDFNEFNLFREKIRDMGYHLSENSKTGIYQFCASKEGETQSGDVHLHLVIENTQRYEDFLILKNYLLTNSAEAQAYSNHKKELINLGITDRKLYRAKKSEYVTALIERSRKFYKKGESMNILVTGGAGYIGSHTIIELIKDKHNVVVVDNFSNSCKESIKRVCKIVGSKIKFYKGDIRNAKLMNKIFAQNKIDWVIHFAGLKAVGESCSMPVEYYDNNLGGTIELLKAMKKAKCKKIVFSSSATVYGDPEVLPLTEDCKVGGTTNPYGTSKYFQEIMLSDLYKSDNEWTVVLLRYFNPVGAHESGLIGEDPKGIPNNLTPYIAKVAIGELNKLGVFGNDYNTKDGTGVRDYIHVVDLAKGHVSAINNVKESGVYTYNLGTGVGYSVMDVIHAYEKACGHEIAYEIKPRRPGDIAACYANADKAKKELKWTAKLGIDEMCQSSWNWQTKNPNGYKKIK